MTGLFSQNKRIDKKTWKSQNIMKTQKSCRSHCWARETGAHTAGHYFSQLFAESFLKRKTNSNTLSGTMSHWTFLPVPAYLVQEESEHS